MDRGGAAALAWLAHPVTLVVIAALVVNDHVLKAAFPGLITGKLSDAAGLVMAPPLLAVIATLLVPRLSTRAAAIIGFVGTALGFAVVKGTAAGAAAASAVWSAVALPTLIRADATDLLTLPALVLAWHAWTRAQHQPVAHRLVRLARALVVLPLGVLAVAATSAPYDPPAVAVAPWRDGIVVGEINAYNEEPDDWRWASYSRDGGQTWLPLSYDRAEQASVEVDRADGERTQACLPDDSAVCYRVVHGHLRVEHTRDGGVTWTTSWEVTDEQRDRLALHYQDLDDPAADLSSHSVLVRPTGGRHVVVVANGRDGYALRDVDGHWQRIGFGLNGDRIPHWDRPSPYVPDWWLWAQVAAVLSGLVMVETVGQRGWRRRLVHAPGLVLIVFGLAAQFLTAAGAANPAPVSSFDYLSAAAVTVGGVAVWLTGLAVNRTLSALQWAIALPAAITVGLIVAVPLAIGTDWRSGAIGAAVLLWGLGTTLAAGLVWGIDRNARTTRVTNRI
ncbi:MAG TPA: sialidase family protein [Jiangellales bacterium]|nr:sialidase family protein [Jiangellales bacterium]